MSLGAPDEEERMEGKHGRIGKRRDEKEGIRQVRNRDRGVTLLVPKSGGTNFRYVRKFGGGALDRAPKAMGVPGDLWQQNRS